MSKYLLTSLLLFILSCSTTRKMKNVSVPAAKEPYVQGPFDKEGHRGCRGLMPENTIPAMLKALQLGVTTLEMDIVFTKNKQAVVSHEPFFNHEITTVMPGTLDQHYIKEEDEKAYNIYRMTYDEVKKFDVGMKPHPRFPQQQKLSAIKPLFSDLIDSIDHYMMSSKRPLPFFNVETKTMPATDNIYHPPPGEFVELLMTEIKQKKIEDRVIIQSFDFRTLQYLHQHHPLMKTAMLIEDTDKRSLEEQLKELGFIPTIYSPDYSLVNKELVNKCHRQNIKVIPWTVDDQAKIQQLKEMGVDGIITDYPDLLNN